MTKTKMIQGKIIRILDKRTVIINLGRNDGIRENSIFHILGEQESIIDPFSEEELGVVKVVKSKLKASQVDEKFTIATTKWTISTTSLMLPALEAFSKMTQTETRVIDQGELLVDEKEIEPWKAQTETPVRIGDTVEVEILIEEEPKPEVMESSDDRLEIEERAEESAVIAENSEFEVSA